MPISADFSSVYSKEFEINFTQCSPNGNLKYTDLCNILQLTAAAHAEIGGISFVDMQAFDQAWVLSRMRVEIETLPKWRDKITVKTWINSLENSRSIRAIEVFINDKKVIGCETFWAVFNTKSRRPEGLKLPFAHFELFPDHKPTQEHFSKIVIPANGNFVIEKKVYLSDLDIVNHVNNVKYLEWCLDLTDTTDVLQGKIQSFEMNFMKELNLNDKIQIYEYIDLCASIFNITKDGKSCFALQLNW